MTGDRPTERAKAQRVFLSYAPADEHLRSELENHLAPLRRTGAIAVWHEQNLLVGEAGLATIEAQIDAADLVLLLVTPDFLGSDELHDEQVRRALQRRETSGARIVPVLVRPCMWEVGPLAKLQPLPKNRQAVTSWSNRDEAWREIVQGVVALLAETSPVSYSTTMPDPRGATRRGEPPEEEPSWALERGEDGSGRYASFAAGGVAQRMRWVPPGRFVMGSPETEAGHNPYEGPRHPVELTRGFWLSDTACTQALWQAVMGRNPSRFRGPDRPVERVSWEDCQAFIARLNGMARGLGARLPTEAEWEYACRAGTTTATWAGDLDIRGENDAPILDAIAWYGGNSGRGFELSGGEDSRDWPEKQYPHVRAGTRPVRGKLPNPMGLFDMLGNVYEWCQDGYRPYEPRGAIDPVGPTRGSSRVLRGSSWSSPARDVRAAERLFHDPTYKHESLGFRIARA